MEAETINQPITKEMMIGQIIEEHPEVVETLLSFGVHCMGCDANPMESLEEGFTTHGFSAGEIDEVVTILNKVVEEEQKNNTQNINDLSLILSDVAAQKIKEICMQKGHKALRVGIRPGGCSGFSYHFELADEATKDDKIIEHQGAFVYADKLTLQKLDGATIDYVDSLTGAGFKIINPNAKASCGCGKSFR